MMFLLTGGGGFSFHFGNQSRPADLAQPLSHLSVARAIHGACAVVHVLEKNRRKLAFFLLQDGQRRQVAKPLDHGGGGVDETFVQPDVNVLMGEDGNTLHVGKPVENVNSVIESRAWVFAALDDPVLGQGQAPQVAAGVDFGRFPQQGFLVDQFKNDLALGFGKTHLQKRFPDSIVHFLEQVQFENSIL